uniref:RNA polymerase III subunit Rpc25 domain-containing protein n=1 Tax=Timema bartmani TaxID=61472 RepID=A0A7R9EXU6_9NEOP|nr:unnamed protein product [Timema bartmani]
MSGGASRREGLNIVVFINVTFPSQVVLNVGLCIALHDIVSLEDSYIFPGDGAAHTKVKFRYVVFRPFIEEVMVGKIRSCSREGVHGIDYRHFTIRCESIRFRVTAESFVETSPSGPDSSERASSDTTTEETKVPYTLTGSINEPGLGLLAWWAN